MHSCPACGALTDTGDRFCSACGGALAAPGPSADPPAGWAIADSPDEPELLLLEPITAGAAPQAGAPEPHSIPRSTGAWLAALAGLLVVAGAVWAFGRGGAGPEQGEGATPTVPTTDARSADSADTAGSDSAGNDPAADGEPAKTEATTDPATGATLYDDEAGGPVLGRPTGWSLLIGDPYQSRLERLDLDTGQRLDFEGVTAAPVAVLDGRLVLQDQDDSTTTLRIVPVDDPAAEGIDVFTSDSSYGPQWPVAPGGDGALWLYYDTPAATTWRLVRLRDGKLLDEVPTPSSFQLYPLLGGGGPEVVTSTSGGVFRRDGTGYRLVSPGRPLTVHQGAVLTTTCSGPADCQLQWLDVDTGEPVDRRLPPAGAVPGVQWSGVVDEAGRLMVGYRLTDPNGEYTLVLFDRDRDRVIEADLEAFSGGIAASPDGRYLAATSVRGVTLYDADEDRWITVPRHGGEGANVVFVANGGAGR